MLILLGMQMPFSDAVCESTMDRDVCGLPDDGEASSV